MLKTSDGDLVITMGQHERDISLTRGSQRQWKKDVQQRFRRRIGELFNVRVVATDTPTEEKPKVARKDYYGIDGDIDITASRALLAGANMRSLRQHQRAFEAAGIDIDDLGLEQYAKDPMKKQRVMALITGSLRCQVRLCKASEIEHTHCHKCREQHSDLEHLLCDCPHWDRVRSK